MKGNKKFDIDLKYGQIREQKVKHMFSKCQIEVKSERDWWQRTGNIAIEYEYRGKPSGIYATTSDYWFHRLELKYKNTKGSEILYIVIH
jgi:hypothetical protein